MRRCVWAVPLLQKDSRLRVSQPADGEVAAANTFFRVLFPAAFSVSLRYSTLTSSMLSSFRPVCGARCARRGVSVASTRPLCVALAAALPLRRLGDSELMVPSICLGTMTWGQQNTEAEAHEQLNYAFDEVRGAAAAGTASLLRSCFLVGTTLDLEICHFFTHTHSAACPTARHQLYRHSRDVSGPHKSHDARAY